MGTEGIIDVKTVRGELLARIDAVAVYADRERLRRTAAALWTLRAWVEAASGGDLRRWHVPMRTELGVLEGMLPVRGTA
jgi:hypothetical protein